jgi:hypothetical protein
VTTVDDDWDQLARESLAQAAESRDDWSATDHLLNAQAVCLLMVARRLDGIEQVLVAGEARVQRGGQIFRDAGR